jgi:hypothetical protein
MVYSIFSTQHWMEVHTQSVNVSRKGVSFLAKQPLALNTVEGTEEANICLSETVSEHSKTGLSGVILFYSRGVRPSKISFNKEGALT